MISRAVSLRLFLALSLASIGVGLAQTAPAPVDAQLKTYQSTSESAEQRFRETMQGAVKIRSEKIKQANDVFAAAVTPAANTLFDVRKKTVATAITQYDARIKEATQKGKEDLATAARAEKDRFLAACKADDDRLAAEIQPIVGGDLSSVPERADEVVDARLVKQQILMTNAFFDKHTATFPSAANLARNGAATASSNTNPEDISTIFGGVRYHDTFALKVPQGWLQATWQKPPVGQYILLFSRPTDVRMDSWGAAHVEVNGARVKVMDNLGGQKVLILDLGRPTAVRSVKIDFQGGDNPGLAGIEIHREMKKK